MSDYEQFAKRFNIKHMQVVRDRGYDSFVYGHNRNTASYYNDREELIEIELTRSGLEQLVKIDRE